MTKAAPQIDVRQRQLLIFVYEAFNHRAMDPILERMHPRVEWPNGMEGGWVHGREEVRAYWTRQWSMIDPHVEPVAFEAEPDGRIAVKVHQLVRSLDGATLLDRMVDHVYELGDGLIKKMEIRE
jgi:SnoaL-like domain